MQAHRQGAFALRQFVQGDNGALGPASSETVECLPTQYQQEMDNADP